MNKILAISGGIDSVSLLHMMHRDPTIIIAHFNHGTRVNSDADAAFVQQLALTYHLPFLSKKESLGPNCSEAHARQRRYHFLKSICKQYRAELYTAHHQDDLIETIVINILRGTGWRGLAPFSDPLVHRPLIHLTKRDIYQYATRHHLIFRHDYTNTDDAYLRNRVRQALIHLSPSSRRQLLAISTQQTTLRQAIDQTLQDLLPPDHSYPRSWFTNLDDNISIEILRAGLAKINHSTTRPGLTNFLSAIRTYHTNKKFNLNGNHLITIKRDSFKLI